MDNIVAIVDRNYLQISGNTEKVMKLEPLEEKWRSFGWEVVSTNGNDIEDLVEAFSSVPPVKGKPTVIIAYTVKGKGVSFMENNPKWHHGVPSKQQFEQAVAELT